ncbi:MAG: ATP-dependent DNA ligase [Verrucomicrobiota bacterium]
MNRNTQPSHPFRVVVDQGDPFLKEAGLHLDPHHARDFSFVSHAHADHFAPHRKIICSVATRQLLCARFSTDKTEFLDLEFDTPMNIGKGLRIKLLPAGHIPGSAMLHVERISDGESLLHTGDFKLRRAHAAESIAPIRADTLIMETTFGLPKFRLPPADEVIAEMVKFARESFEEEQVPVFMAYSLGKAQEIILSLSRADPKLSFAAHPSVERMNRIVSDLGYSLPAVMVADPKSGIPRDHVFVIPPNAAKSRAMRAARKNIRMAMVSGWGMDSGAKFRYQCDEVFPLSDHADYADLLRFVELVNPKLVWTIHGFVDEFARDLRALGHDAWPLRTETQLEFALQDSSYQIMNSLKSQDSDTSNPERPPSEFAEFTAICERLATSTGKLQKQTILANYLNQLDDLSLQNAATFFSGRPLGKASDVRTSGIGWATLRQALLDVSGMSLAQYRQISSSQADASRTTYLILQGKTNPQPHSIREVAEYFKSLATQSGLSDKLRQLRKLLFQFHHSEAAILVGILTGDLRIGLKEGLLEEAISEAFSSRTELVRRAHMLSGHLGETALLARHGQLEQASIKWFTPIKVMLASPAEDSTEIIARLGGADSSRHIWLEDKFDGIRAQIHKEGQLAEIFSRDLKPLQEQFPELTEAAREISRDCILDGEIIAYADGKRLSFFDLQKRLGKASPNREQGDLFLGEAIPVRFIAFDLLAYDGESCLDLSLVKRREKLETLDLPDSFRICETHFATDQPGIESAFKAAKQRRNEGLIAKDPDSTYSPGRRGKQWLKLKKAMPTLDVVVVKAQQGHGKRAHVLSDYTFAVWDEEEQGHRVIGKAYSGLTDEEIEELTEHFKKQTISCNRSIHTVIPDTVLEVAFDSIQPSKRHDSGLSLRFPRIKAIRRDKSPEEIDTLAFARKLSTDLNES